MIEPTTKQKAENDVIYEIAQKLNVCMAVALETIKYDSLLNRYFNTAVKLKLELHENLKNYEIQYKKTYAFP
jgi:hypothetical protein